MKTKCSPRFKSYVCSERPTEVVIWKVVLPSGIEVKGMLVGDTRPTVYCRCVSSVNNHVKLQRRTRNGANILDWRRSSAELFSPAAWTFWRLVTGPSGAFDCSIGPAILTSRQVLAVVGGKRAVLSQSRYTAQKVCGDEIRLDLPHRRSPNIRQGIHAGISDGLAFTTWRRDV